jgi:hypothetical protein
LLQRLEFRSLLNNLPANMQSQTPKEDYVGGVKLKLPKNVLIDSNEKLKDLKIADSNNYLFTPEVRASMDATRKF